jgi:hypothetical protein
VDADLDTLATALYVKIDAALKTDERLGVWRPAVGFVPKLADAELCILAVLQALLGIVSEARWLRYARAHLGHLFPYLPRQPGAHVAHRTVWLRDPQVHRCREHPLGVDVIGLIGHRLPLNDTGRSIKPARHAP